MYDCDLIVTVAWQGREDARVELTLEDGENEFEME
jgi:hypothetical protein